MTTNTVTDEGSGRKYWTQVPNIVFDLGLRPFPLALYGQLKRITGADGQCDETTRQLADRLWCSPMAISKALAELAIARPELGGKALIRVAKVADGKGARKPRNIIALVDVWPENMSRYGGQPVNTVDGTVNNMYGAVNTVYGGRKHSVHPKEPEKNEEHLPAAAAAPGELDQSTPPKRDAWLPLKEAIATVATGKPKVTGAKGQPVKWIGSLVGDVGRIAGDDVETALAIWAAFEDALTPDDREKYINAGNVGQRFTKWSLNGGAGTIRGVLARRERAASGEPGELPDWMAA